MAENYVDRTKLLSLRGLMTRMIGLMWRHRVTLLHIEMRQPLKCGYLTFSWLFDPPLWPAGNGWTQVTTMESCSGRQWWSDTGPPSAPATLKMNLLSLVWVLLCFFLILCQGKVHFLFFIIRYTGTPIAEIDRYTVVLETQRGSRRAGIGKPFFCSFSRYQSKN